MFLIKKKSPQQETKGTTSTNVAPTTERKNTRLLLLKRGFLLLLVLLLFAWALIPALRAFTLVANASHRSAPVAPGDLHVQNVRFQATDGVQLAGWLVIVSPDAPTIILVHGFKGSRTDMLPWARFLSAAGYNVLLYDSRGCGESEGWGITLGAREPNDVVGAVRYLQQRSDLHTKHFGALGVSLGAGIVLLAAAREPGLMATVADSSWTDESFQIDHMSSFAALPPKLSVLIQT